MEEDILIEKFIKGELTQEEKEAFLMRLSTDADFKHKVELEKELYASLNDTEWNPIDKKAHAEEIKEYVKAFHAEDVLALKETLKKSNDTYQVNAAQKKQKNVFRYAIIAVSILVLGIGAMWKLQTKTPEQLYAAYIQINELPSMLTRSNDQNSLIKAQHVFEKGNYKEAVALFKREEEKYSNYKGIIAIYVGVAQTEMEQYKQAENTFDELIKSELIDATKGYWYKALIYLKQGKIPETQKALKLIIERNYYNANKAQELLDKL